MRVCVKIFVMEVSYVYIFYFQLSNLPAVVVVRRAGFNPSQLIFCKYNIIYQPVNQLFEFIINIFVHSNSFF